MVTTSCDDMDVTDEEILSGFTSLRDAMQSALTTLTTRTVTENQAEGDARITTHFGRSGDELRSDLRSAIGSLQSMTLGRLDALEQRLAAMEARAAWAGRPATRGTAGSFCRRKRTR